MPAADNFTIAIGEIVSDGVPGVGAGNIETPGSKNIYEFSATAGQSILLDLQNNTGLAQLNWRLLNPGGAVVFDDNLFLGSRGPFTLTDFGLYTIEIGGEQRVDETGTYQFELTTQ